MIDVYAIGSIYKFENDLYFLAAGPEGFDFSLVNLDTGVVHSNIFSSTLPRLGMTLIAPSFKDYERLLEFYTR